MRALFSVAAKLLAVFITLQALIHASTALAFVGQGTGRVAVISVVHAVLALGIAYLLAFRTDRLADLLRAPADHGEPAVRIAPREALRTGIVLIALYVLVTRIGHLAGAVSLWMAGGPATVPLRSLLGEGLPVLLALAIILWSKRVVEWIPGFRERATERDAGERR